MREPRNIAVDRSLNEESGENVTSVGESQGGPQHVPYLPTARQYEALINRALITDRQTTEHNTPDKTAYQQTISLDSTRKYDQIVPVPDFRQR